MIKCNSNQTYKILCISECWSDQNCANFNYMQLSNIVETTASAKAMYFRLTK